MAEQLETAERAHAAQRPMLGAAACRATSLLSGCATVSSDVGGHGACPPVVEYSREFQSRAAAELDLLPEGSAIAEMLADYAVMREQAGVCSQFETQN
jgi:hypothetical protein